MLPAGTVQTHLFEGGFTPGLLFSSLLSVALLTAFDIPFKAYEQMS